MNQEETALFSTADPLIGEIMGDAIIEELIGRGGMGAVYRGRHLKLDIPVAVKVLFSRPNEPPNMVERFLREARLAARLEHENIVRVMNVGNKGDTFFIIEQLLDGESVLDLVERKGRLPWREAAGIILGVAKGLEEAHGQGILHRDIKPANIIMTRTGVKIVDFGLAREINDDYGLTLPQMSMGTPDYLSPEQGMGGSVDERSDLYSLGVTFYNLVTGKVPFKGKTLVETILKHKEEPPPPPREIAPDLPMAVERIILKLMMKEKEERYQSARELIEGIDSILSADAAVRSGADPAAAPGSGAVAPVSSAYKKVFADSGPPVSNDYGDIDIQRGDTMEAVKYWALDAVSSLLLLSGIILALSFGAGASSLAVDGTGLPGGWIAALTDFSGGFIERLSYLVASIVVSGSGILLWGRCLGRRGRVWLAGTLFAISGIVTASAGIMGGRETLLSILSSPGEIASPAAALSALLVLFFFGTVMRIEAEEGRHVLEARKLYAGSSAVLLSSASLAAMAIGIASSEPTGRVFDLSNTYIYLFLVLFFISAGIYLSFKGDLGIASIPLFLFASAAAYITGVMGTAAGGATLDAITVPVSTAMSGISEAGPLTIAALFSVLAGLLSKEIESVFMRRRMRRRRGRY